MAIIKCAECGTDVSDKAAACVKCGAPIARTAQPSRGSPVAAELSKNMSAGSVVGVLFLAALFAWYGWHSYRGSVDKAAAEEAHSAAIPAIVVAAEELMADYDQNEVAADMKYKGKKLSVAGVVESIDKDFKGDPYVLLSSGAAFSHVHATFAKEAAGQLATLHKGEPLTLTCVGSGMILKSPMLDCAP